MINFQSAREFGTGQRLNPGGTVSRVGATDDTASHARLFVCLGARQFLLKTAIVLAFVSVCYGREFKDYLVEVHGAKVHFSLPPKLEEMESSGICLTEGCSIVVTVRQSIKDMDIVQVSGISTGKVVSRGGEIEMDRSGVLLDMGTDSNNIANDISFVYTTRPVVHKLPVPLSYRPYVGQIVTVATYRNRKLEKKAARIVGVDVPVAIGHGQLLRNLIVDVELSLGSGGSALFDGNGNLLGMIILSGALSDVGRTIQSSVAIRTSTIGNALVVLDPAVGSAIFHDLPEDQPVAHAALLRFQERVPPPDASPVMPELSLVPIVDHTAVARTRANADLASKAMSNFIAKQCFVQGIQRPICHEVAVVDGEQSFRSIRSNGKLGNPTTSFPRQAHSVWTESDWTDSLGQVVDNPWILEGSVQGGYLFSFKSYAEDDRCYYKEYSPGASHLGDDPKWQGSVACFEQILTDGDFNVIAAFAQMLPPNECFIEVFESATYYDWLKLGSLHPVLLPTREQVTARVHGQKNIWQSELTWTDYRKFRATHDATF